MHTSTDITDQHRQYRLASGVLTVGALACGMLVLEQLVIWANAPIMSYYGLTSGEFAAVTGIDTGVLSVTVSQVATVTVALFGLMSFVVGERRRIGGIERHQAECQLMRELQVAERPSLRQLAESFVARTSLFGGVMLLCWILQTSYERYVAGMGWGLPYYGVTSVLPLASIFGLCLLVGMFVAGVGLFGMRVLGSLERLMRSLSTRARTVTLQVCMLPVDERTMRERFGTTILSRPPPAWA